MKRSLLICSALTAVSMTAVSAFGQPGEPVRRRGESTDAAPTKDESAAEPERRRTPSSSILWVDSGIGWQRVGLTTLRVQRDAGGDALTGDLVPAVLDGPSVGLGFGIRWLVLTFGARATAAFFNEASPDVAEDASQFYSLDGELGLRVPAGRIEPSIVFGAGYSVFGGLGDAIRGVRRGLDIDGANLRLALGLDYFMTDTWSIGARAAGEILFLSRSGVPLRDLARAESVNTLGEAKTRLLEGEGTSAGTAFSLTIGPGLHF